jgi:hypothetical protein
MNLILAPPLAHSLVLPAVARGTHTLSLPTAIVGNLTAFVRLLPIRCVPGQIPGVGGLSMRRMVGVLPIVARCVVEGQMGVVAHMMGNAPLLAPTTHTGLHPML